MYFCTLQYQFPNCQLELGNSRFHTDGVRGPSWSDDCRSWPQVRRGCPPDLQRCPPASRPPEVSSSLQTSRGVLQPPDLALHLGMTCSLSYYVLDGQHWHGLVVWWHHQGRGFTTFTFHFCDPLLPRLQTGPEVQRGET